MSLEFGNLAWASDSWRTVESLYRSGMVAATLVGSPCETFSEARFQVPPESNTGRPYPRPLRTAEWLFGIEGLTLRELRQCHLGGNFFQQAALTLCMHMAHGGCFVSEHPAKPHDARRPSVWTSPLIELLRQHPDVHLSHVSQYLWGATVVKPTGLLHYCLPHFCRDLYTQADVHAKRPSEVAIGRDDSGRFRTAQHKEYPDQFCRGLAFTIVQRLAEVERQHAFRVTDPLVPHLYSWILGAAQASSVVHRATWLPDFQDG